LDEHKKVASMFQYGSKVHMTNILLKLFDLEIKKQVDHRGEKQICLESARGFGEGAKAQSIITR
jgi:hypothetical protein